MDLLVSPFAPLESSIKLKNAAPKWASTMQRTWNPSTTIPSTKRFQTNHINPHCFQTKNIKPFQKEKHLGRPTELFFFFGCFCFLFKPKKTPQAVLDEDQALEFLQSLLQRLASARPPLRRGGEAEKKAELQRPVKATPDSSRKTGNKTAMFAWFLHEFFTFFARKLENLCTS